jgi:hypothetical protein
MGSIMTSWLAIHAFLVSVKQLHIDSIKVENFYTSFYSHNLEIAEIFQILLHHCYYVRFGNHHSSISNGKIWLGRKLVGIKIHAYNLTLM